MKTKLLLLAGALVALQFFATVTLAVPPNYMIFHIGTIDSGDYGSQGRDVSRAMGFVTGRNLGDNNQAILWSEDTGLIALPNHPDRPYGAGNGVNFHGTVVGNGTTTVWGSGPLPLIWENGAVAILPLPNGETLGRAEAINNLGVVAGSVNGGSQQRAAIYADGTATVITATTSTGCYANTFYGINDDGLAVGTGLDPNNAARNVGFVYDIPSDTAVEVGFLPGDNGALAFGMSNAGHVVGSSMLNQGDGTPFIWSEAEGMVEIPLPDATSLGSAKGANSSGWAVGTAGGVYAIPFLYDSEATYRIHDLIPDGTGWDLAENTSSSAVAISDDGIIVGTGMYEGAPSAYAMVPDDVVPLLLQEFTAAGCAEGIEISWEIFLVDGSLDFSLERSVSMNGPWDAVTAPVFHQGANSKVLDSNTEANQTYYYRLSAPGHDNEALVMGYVTAQRVGVLGLSLSAPAPNPAPGRTSLAYRIPGQQAVQMTVHDLRGRLVRTLIDGSADEGEHLVQWDGRDNRGTRAPAGVYFINLKASKGSLTRRVVLTR